MKRLTKDFLDSILEYDKDSGILTWKKRSESSLQYNKSWNSRYAGKEAGSKRFQSDSLSYITVSIGSKERYYAHRIIWIMTTGCEPDQIDHINGDGTDNSLKNLRSTSQGENTRNQKKSITNKSGCTGVCWCSRKGKWRSYIGSGKGAIHIGYYQLIDDAISARKEKEVELNYHNNHGRDLEKMIGKTD